MDRSMNIFLILMYIGLILFSILNIVQGEENVALRRNTRQSSTYNDQYSSGVSSLAVDGNTDNFLSRGSCSHTLNNGTNWWCVDLHRDIDFQNIKIYNRNTHQYRLQGFEIRLSSNNRCNNNGYQQSTVCYKDTSTTTQDIYNIDSCNQQQVQFNSRYVYISVDNTGDKPLTLCEVEIFEKHHGASSGNTGVCGSNCHGGCDSNGICNKCVSGYYGNTCVTPCPTNCNGGCQQSNGNCIGGCENGYYGNKCVTPCPTKCNGSCQQSNGNCINGCKSGYRGKICNSRCESNCNLCHQTDDKCTECNPGYRGYQCRTSCDRNCYNGCQSNSGNCIGGCKNGFWGLKCNDICNKCIQGCQQNTGDCNSGGCISGYYGNKCDTPCPTNCNGDCQQSNGNCVACSDGYWGDKCEERCPANCQSQNNNPVCNKTNGYCTSGCIKGYYGDVCNQECSSNCLEKKCYQDNGMCIDDSISGKIGNNCPEECSDGISPVVAGIIGALTSMVLLLIGNVILVYWCLKKRNKREKLNEQTVRYTTSDNVEITRTTFENVQDDVTSSQVEAGPHYESFDGTLPSPTYETLK